MLEKEVLNDQTGSMHYVRLGWTQDSEVDCLACQAMVGLAEVDPDAVWLILARLAWEGGTFEAPRPDAPHLPPATDLFPPNTIRPARITALATVAAALIEKVNKITPPWLKEAVAGQQAK